MSSGYFLWNWAKHSGIFCTWNAVWVEKVPSLSCSGIFGNSLGSILKCQTPWRAPQPTHFLPKRLESPNRPETE